MRDRSARRRDASARAPVRLVLIAAGVLVVLSAGPAWALWADSSAVSGSTVSTTSIKPLQTTSNACVVSGTGQSRVATLSWQAVAPAGTTYAVTLREDMGQTLTATRSGATWSTTLRVTQAPVTLFGDTVDVDVTARLGSAWTATSTRAIAVGGFRSSMTCQDWT